ncbi:DUF6273 domain-containing protein [Dethiothermospora halolimnae]|uniref:DUF6273 domain-containing protein n=1 Tax=Dethiothermospora halolimnae TaxID=3114390 RepID=UPI003CCBF113
MRKAMVMFLVFTLLFSLVPIKKDSYVFAQNNIKIGDYIYFGNYYGEPILWRIINIDEDGNPLLFSNNILTLKAYDTNENNWERSTIRTWLNSGEEKVRYSNKAPSKDNVEGNCYDKESGFLYGFTKNEKKSILPIEHRVILAKRDYNERTGGSKPLVADYELHWKERNKKYSKLYLGAEHYYNNAYYKNIKDSVFLLSVREVKKYVLDRKWDYNAYPTKQALENAEVNYLVYHSKSYLSEDENAPYWFRTPMGDSEDSVVLSGYWTVCDSVQVYAGEIGVRPALYLNLSKISLKEGTGTKKSPYKLAYANKS